MKSKSLYTGNDNGDMNESIKPLQVKTSGIFKKHNSENGILLKKIQEEGRKTQTLYQEIMTYIHNQEEHITFFKQEIKSEQDEIKNFLKENHQSLVEATLHFNKAIEGIHGDMDKILVNIEAIKAYLEDDQSSIKNDINNELTSIEKEINNTNRLILSIHSQMVTTPKELSSKINKELEKLNNLLIEFKSQRSEGNIRKDMKSEQLVSHNEGTQNQMEHETFQPNETKNMKRHVFNLNKELLTNNHHIKEEQLPVYNANDNSKKRPESFLNGPHLRSLQQVDLKSVRVADSHAPIFNQSLSKQVTPMRGQEKTEEKNTEKEPPSNVEFSRKEIKDQEYVQEKVYTPLESTESYSTQGSTVDMELKDWEFEEKQRGIKGYFTSVIQFFNKEWKGND